MSLVASPPHAVLAELRPVLVGVLLLEIKDSSPLALVEIATERVALRFTGNNRHRMAGPAGSRATLVWDRTRTPPAYVLTHLMKFPTGPKPSTRRRI